MGLIYLDFLPECMEEASRASGLPWEFFDDDWLHRSRSTGGYASLPYCVMWHHTAGADNAWGDAYYMCYQADARPVANICVDSSIGILMAGGATNTNGSGRSLQFSRGTVESDNMNQRAVGIEICNNGVGAQYRSQVLDFVFALSNAINERCGNQPTDVMTHQHYAPDRKVDPATAAACQGSWKPRAVNSSGSWDVQDLQLECEDRADTRPTPPPPEEEDDVPKPVVLRASDCEEGVNDHLFWWDGQKIGWVRTAKGRDLGKLMGLYIFDGDGNPFRNFSVQDIQRTIGSSWSGGPVPTGWNPPKEGDVDSGVT